MKKHSCVLLASILCLSSFSACGEQKVPEENTKKGIVLTATSEADFVELADTLEELAMSSDFIAKIKVTEANTYVYPNTDSICTSITPEILERYKGEYNGEQLDMYGGHMSYADYYGAPVFQEDWHTFDTSTYTKEELETALIYWDWCNVYIPNAGDTLIYFGKQSNNNNYFLTNGYQGLFHLEDNTWTNQALIIDDDSDWQEPLVTDLLTLPGASAADCKQKTFTQTIDGITYTHPQSNYETMVAVPEEALTARLNEICA